MEESVDSTSLSAKKLRLSAVKPSGSNDDSAATEEQGPMLHRGIPSTLKQVSDPCRSSDADHIIAKNENGCWLRCQLCHSTKYYMCIACKLACTSCALLNMMKTSDVELDSVYRKHKLFTEINTNTIDKLIEHHCNTQIHFSCRSCENAMSCN